MTDKLPTQHHQDFAVSASLCDITGMLLQAKATGRRMLYLAKVALRQAKGTEEASAT